jgi:dihydroorotate dehydrogenase electron transfer subunit
MKQFDCAVTFKEELWPGAWLMDLEAPGVGQGARPGQFVHVRCSEGLDPLLRRPISLHRIADDRITLLFQIIGRGTAWLAERREGDTVDVLGPLGNGFEIAPKSTHLVLVAGCLGVAPLGALAELAQRKELETTLLYGCDVQEEVFPDRYLPASVEYQIASRDGTVGFSGLVTAMLPEVLPWADQVFACGPRGMIEAIKSLVLRDKGRIRHGFVQVSLEEHMACGVGACLGCVVDTKHGLQRVCADGPVFDLADLL